MLDHAAAPQTVPWQLVDVGRGSRALVISYEQGGCDGAVSVALAETGTSVRITLTRPGPVPGQICPAYIAIRTRTVPLSRPVHGRHVLGGGARIEAFARGALVPRVLGLWPPDARRLLMGQAFTAVHVSGRAPRRRVLAQDPAAHAARRGDRIALRAGP